MGTKSSQLQIRVSPAQKASIRRLAEAAGKTISVYVLEEVLPSTHVEFNRLAVAIAGATSLAKALSDLEGHLSALSPEEFLGAVSTPELEALSPLLQNYVAATVEQEAGRKRLDPPQWTKAIPPLPRPHFGWDMRGLRPHLMRVTPLTFKRRNVFLGVSDDERL
jgi:hypothetical protein